MKENAEIKLIRQAKAGNKPAFSQLVKLYQQQLLYFLYDLTGNYYDAKDLAQDAFLRAFEKINQFREEAQFSSWLFRIAINLSLDFFRKHKNKLFSLDDLAPDAKETTEFADPTVEIEQQALKKQILKLVDTLSLQQRTVVILKYYHEKSYKEIAEILECTESTVRNHHARAMEKLRKVSARIRNG